MLKLLKKEVLQQSHQLMYDIIRKFSSGKKINLSLTDCKQIQVESEKSILI